MYREVPKLNTGGVSKVRPRLDIKPWGGRKLEQLGLKLPDDELIGEAAITAGDAVIEEGFGSGFTIAEVMDANGGIAFGDIALRDEYELQDFPILAKLIDARQNLSIQVHPDDDQAAAFGHSGKTEAWHILDAEPGSKLYAGLRPGIGLDEFAEAARRQDGSSAALLREIPAEVGATILLPAGTIHALGAGVTVYEIQQPSGVTYRLDDWGRVDEDGNPRDMHLDEGLTAAKPDVRPELIAPVDVSGGSGMARMLTMCEMFALKREAGSARHSVVIPREGTPQILTVIEGSAHFGELELAAGESAIIWPDTQDATFETSVDSVTLLGWLPDIAGYLEKVHAHIVHDLESLAQLSGPLPDVRRAMETRMDNRR